MEKVIIKNINERYGDPVLFEGNTLNECVDEMVKSVYLCGYPVPITGLREGVDYEILEGDNV